MPVELTVAAAMVLGGLVQSTTGFGFGLVALPILASATSFGLAAPLLALNGVGNGTFMWLRYRRHFQWVAVRRMVMAAIAGIPVGLYGLRYAPESAMLVVLGVIIGSYALYSLTRIASPKLRSPFWAYGFGFCSGMLSGAYNIPGPPAVFYGQCCGWAPEQFKGNLTGFFAFNTATVIIGHALQHRITADVLRLLAIALPCSLTGFIIGTYLSRFIHPTTFRTLVLVLLIITGIRLVLAGVGLKG